MPEDYHQPEKRFISGTFNKATGICASETTNQNIPPLKAVSTPGPVHTCDSSQLQFKQIFSIAIDQH